MANTFKNNDPNLTRHVAGDELSPSQIRLIRSLNIILNHILSTPDENEFFEGSAEMMQICASLIKQSNFAAIVDKKSKIPYAKQAIEYAIDLLQEQIQNTSFTKYDN